MKEIKLIAILLFSVIWSNAQTNWISKASLPGSARHHPVTFSIEGKAYLVSGSANGNVMLKDFYRYDPETDAWTKLPDFPGLARGFAEAVVYNNKAYFGFGMSQTRAALNDLWEFDPATNQWKQLARCGCSGRLHPALVATTNGRIYVGAGSANSNMKDWWEYNISTNTWFRMTDLPGNERHHPFYFGIGTNAFMGLGHGSVFVPGANRTSTNIYRDWYKFNSVDSTWTKMGDFPGEGRVAGSQNATKDYGYVVSGENEFHQNFDTGQVYQYDPNIDTWTEQEPHPGSSRWATSTFIIDRTAYVVAGEDADGVRLNSMLSYDLTLIANEKAAEEKEQEEQNPDLTSVEFGDEANDYFRMFPNPIRGALFIELGLSESINVSILDMSGKVVHEDKTEGQSIELNLSGLNAGMYIVEIEGDNVYRKERLLKH